ncbi:DUF2783 domain-containing protein [Lentibacter algarum]|uniref:DUF2783 domain-containing protein n=1 Tax=Lentibacter algarum TaxID=576131 RepID=UPI001C09961C|nr:DUF2783 domain-containing protein [Lentibacter algarum]MBU2983188.1 DUF2783 domain-containing protein [Lentibacter algarum]
MADLILTPNIASGDDFYEELISAHDGLSKEDSDAYNARLLLILANHIGDREALSAAIKAAKRQS